MELWSGTGAENCPYKDRATLETPMTVRDGGGPHRPVSSFLLALRCRTRQSIAPATLTHTLELASKRPSPEALRCPSGQASVTKKRRSIYKESDRNVVRDRVENCPCKNRVTVETAMTVRDGGAPYRPVSTFVPLQCFLMKSMSSVRFIA